MIIRCGWVSSVDHQRPPSFKDLGQNAVEKPTQAPSVFAHTAPAHRWDYIPRRIGNGGAYVAAGAPIAAFSHLPKSHHGSIVTLARFRYPSAVSLGRRVT